jgi:rRNA-processing protein FCF1
MSKRKRRKELADLRRVKLMASLDEKGKIDIPRPSQKNCEHVWKVFCNLENSMEIEYSCEKCLIHKTETKSYKKFESNLLPHELKNHGPAQHHINPRRYTAPSKSHMLIGDMVEKTMIFQRCLQTGIIKKNVIGMENKIKVVDKIIPKIIIDECVANSTLIKKIQELGYNIWYLGRKLSDDEILEVVEKQNAVLITEDKEFHNRVLDNKPIRDPIFVSRNTNQIMENVGVIQKHMRQFEE